MLSSRGIALQSIENPFSSRTSSRAGGILAFSEEISLSNMGDERKRANLAETLSVWQFGTERAKLRNEDGMGERERGLPYMTSTQFWDFWTPSPPLCLQNI